MNTLRRRLDRLGVDTEKPTFIVVAGDGTTEEEIRDAVRRTGQADPFDVVSVIDSFGTPSNGIEVKDRLPFSLSKNSRSRNAH